MKGTDEVNTNGTYVTVDVRIILHTKSNLKISESHLQRFERESNQKIKSNSQRIEEAGMIFQRMSRRSTEA